METTIKNSFRNNTFYAKRNKRRLNKQAYNNNTKEKLNDMPSHFLLFISLAIGLIGLVIWEYINSC